MYGEFLREMGERVDKTKSCNWLGNGDLKIQTEAILRAVQELSVGKRYLKHCIDKSIDNPLSKICS